MPNLFTLWKEYWYPMKNWPVINDFWCSTVTLFDLMDSLRLSMQSPKRLSPSFVSKLSKVTCLWCPSCLVEHKKTYSINIKGGLSCTVLLLKIRFPTYMKRTQCAKKNRFKSRYDEKLKIGSKLSQVSLNAPQNQPRYPLPWWRRSTFCPRTFTWPRSISMQENF